MDELVKIKQELDRTKIELGILYEISNAMRTTLKLDEILYIILTGVTSHICLGFNRAMLFLVNENEGLIEGRMGIGPDTAEDANAIWTQIEQEKLNLEDLISVYKDSSGAVESGFNKQVRGLKFALGGQNAGLLSLGVLDGMPLHLTKETMQNYRDDPIVKTLKNDELIIVPLKAKDKVNGLILADNFVTRQPITKNDIRMLTMLANQAGLAIENSQLYEKAIIRAHSDYLTDLWNHGYFQSTLLKELEKTKNIQSKLTLIMIDIDDFKVYNDTLGHQAGDSILKELALLLKKESRKADYVCRYGGEEFTIILPHTDKNEAYLLAERLRVAIEKHLFSHEEILPKKKLTVSMGLATSPDDGNSASELIAASDKALYEAKHKGKNITCC
ncbi:MAG: sensor domain-containing diguanylate cyclase [Candidatus Omnitrophica bacterium]|nr:sensor domain-containing diguanylate cyclase [Candidatus Omnitrophota bacterium]